jgi:arylsulfatase A-like enzyme
MTRRGFLKALGFGAAAVAVGPALGRAALAAGAAAPAGPGGNGAKKPNFVIIFTDDQGYQDVGCFGSPKIKTPNLDRMAAEGMKFTDFYSAASVCSPSRLALMTGCYPPRVGDLPVLFPASKIGLNPEETTIAEILKAQGYATAAIGKWHLGYQKQFLPTSNGFDSYLGVPYSNDMTLAADMEFAPDARLDDGLTAEKLQAGEKRQNHVPLMRDEKVIDYPIDQDTLTQRYTAEAIRLLNLHKGRPFFIYFAHTMPHVPLHASEKFKGTSARGLYGDVIEEIDWSVGEVLKTLKQLGLDDNTLVFFCSDNGPWLAKGADGGCALPLRDGKFSTWDGGMREPTIMRLPGKIPAGTVCSEVAGTIDMLPTIASLVGAKLPARVIDGKDIWPLMTGKPGAKSPHEAYYYYRGGKLEALRQGKWKLRLAGKPAAKKPAKNDAKNDAKTDAKNNAKKKAEYAGPELYDLAADIGETTNVADKNPDVVAALDEIARKFDAELKANARPPGKV